MSSEFEVRCIDRRVNVFVYFINKFHSNGLFLPFLLIIKLDITDEFSSTILLSFSPLFARS